MRATRALIRCARAAVTLATLWHASWRLCCKDSLYRYAVRIAIHNAHYDMRCSLISAYAKAGGEVRAAQRLCAGLLPEGMHPDTPQPDTFVQPGVGQA